MSITQRGAAVMGLALQSDGPGLVLGLQDEPAILGLSFTPPGVLPLRPLPGLDRRSLSRLTASSDAARDLGLRHPGRGWPG